MSNLSYVTHEGDGATVMFPIAVAGENIGYFRTSDIHVYVDGVEVSFTIDPNSPHLVVLSSAPADGSEVIIRRIMPKDSTYANFERGNNFGQRQVNNSFLQQLYTTQELLDGFWPEGYYWKQDVNAGGKLLKNLGDAVDPDDAIKKSVTDQLDERLITVEEGIFSDSRYIHWLYNDGAAIGGELKIYPPFKFKTISTVYINGVRQTYGLAFDYNTSEFSVEFAEELEDGDEVVVAIGTEPKDFIPESHELLTDRNAVGAHDDIYNRNFNSVSGLRSSTDSSGNVIDMSLLIGRTIKVLNYYDGVHGGGFKGKVKYGAHVDNGFTVFSVTDDIYVEQIISGDAVNIRKAGAKSGDENFDSSVAVNTILAAGYTPKIPDSSFYGADTVLIDNQTIKGVSRESSKWISRVVNKPVFKIINSATGNTTNRSDMKDFCIVGQEDPLNNSEVLLEVGTDSNGFVATADIRGMRFFGGSNGNILLNGGVECNIIGNDIWRSKGVGIYINPKANFTNTNRITQNRIKNNWIGIACSAYENIGVFSPPTIPTSLELGNIKIYNNLLEENTNSNNDEPWFDYTSGLGTNTRPGIGILLEGSHDVKVYDNWIESYYQGIRLNFRNKFTYINDNLLGYSRYQTDLQGTGRDEFGGLVLDSTGDKLGNSGNIIKENDFVMKNEYTGGNFEGDHLLLKGIYNQGNLFLDNFTDTIGSDRNITITSDTFSDKNFIEYVDKSDNDDMGRVIDGYIKANYVVAERIDRISENTNLVTDNLEGLDAGSNGLIKRMRSRNTAGTIDRGTFDIFATPYTSTDASNKTGILYGTANPEGLGAISDYDEGTIYIRKGAGLYVKDSERGVATGWFNLNSLIP